MSVPAPVLTMKLEEVIVDAVIPSLKVTLIADPRGIAVEFGAGEADMTWGGVKSGAVTIDEAVSADKADTLPSFPFAETAYL